MAGRTGPKTPAGKAKSAGNAVKHGLRSNQWMFPDEQKAYTNLVNELESEYHPITATQWILLERIAICTTKLRRLHLIEDARFHRARVEDVNSKLDHHPNSSALTLEQTEIGALPPLPLLETLSRYQTTLDRQLSKAIGEMMALKAQEKLNQTQLLSVANTNPDKPTD